MAQLRNAVEHSRFLHLVLCLFILLLSPFLPMRLSLYRTNVYSGHVQ